MASSMGMRSVKVCFSGSPIMAAHSSSVRLGRLSSVIVCCIVLTIRARVSAMVPSKSSMTDLSFVVIVYFFGELRSYEVKKLRQML